MEPDWGTAALALVEAIDHRVAVLELVEGRVVVRAANPALAHAFGLEPAELVDQPGERFYPARELADVTAKVRTVLDSRRPLAYEAVRELPQGRLVVVGRMVPLEHRRVLAFGADVSREREAESQLRQLEELGDIGVWGWNVVDDVLTWSEHYRRLHGLAPDVAPSLALGLGLTHPDDRAAVEALSEEVRTAGRSRPIRYRIVRPDGVVRHVEGRSEALRDEAGRVVRVVGTVQDVTEQHELGERDRRLEEAARHQAQAMELNDDIVQELSRAWLALELDDTDTVRQVIEATTSRVRAMVSALLQATVADRGGIAAGDLVRERPSGGGT